MISFVSQQFSDFNFSIPQPHLTLLAIYLTFYRCAHCAHATMKEWQE